MVICQKRHESFMRVCCSLVKMIQCRKLFSPLKREILITFYKANPASWNHGMAKYRDRNLHRAFLQKLVLEFDEKFSEEEIKKDRNTLSTYHKREKQKELLSKPSGAGTDQVFKLNWEHLDQMVFLETMPHVDDSLNTLKQDENLKSLPSKKAKSSQESDAKDALWTALANSLSFQTSSLQANIAGTKEKSLKHSS